MTARFAARNPAFDVTPAALIAAIVTETGVHRAPYASRSPGGGRRVKAIVLAAGYATRLRPLTDTLREGAAAGRRPADRSTGSSTAIDEVDEVDEVHVVTNARKAPRVRATGRQGREVDVHDDGTTSNEDRLGAIGDMRFVDRARPGSTTTCS